MASLEAQSGVAQPSESAGHSTSEGDAAVQGEESLQQGGSVNWGMPLGAPGSPVRRWQPREGAAGRAVAARARAAPPRRRRLQVRARAPSAPTVRVKVLKTPNVFSQHTKTFLLKLLYHTFLMLLLFQFLFLLLSIH